VKTIPVALASHYASATHTVAYAILIERTDGEVYGFTSHDQSVTIAAQLYDSAPGLDVSQLVCTAGFAVDNLELTTLDDGTVFTRDDVLSRRWDNASFYLFKFNWNGLTDGVEPCMKGTFGMVTLRKQSVVVELRGLQQYFQQPVGNPSTKTCRAHFADFPTQNGSNRCGLVAATYTTTGTITSVVSNQDFTASALAGATDYYTEGVLTWTAGNNIGLRQKIKTHTTGGVLSLSLPMVLTVQVGDTFSIIAGCRKRMNEDCSTKFSNQLNFQGEPHRPTTDDLTKNPETSV
jgi:uncharacterized phage protein (TIGR02218 family)